MNDESLAEAKIRELLANDKDAQAFESTLLRLKELAERSAPYFIAIQSGDPIRIVEAKELAQTAINEWELLINEMLLRFNVVSAKFQNSTIQEQFRTFVSKLSLPFELAREQLNRPEFLFRSTGKEIGDA